MTFWDKVRRVCYNAEDMWSDFWSGIWGVIILSVMIIIVVAVVLGAIIGALIIDPSRSVTCDSVTTKMGVRGAYKVETGCMIEAQPGQWIPLENYRYTEGE